MTSDDDKPLTPAQARQKLQKGLMNDLAGMDTGPIILRLKRNMDQLNAKTGEAAVHARNADLKRLMAVQVRVGKFFEQEYAEVFGFAVPKT